jgi:hypothetical protein
VSVSGTAVLRWIESIAVVTAIVFGVATIAQPMLVIGGSRVDLGVIAIFLLAMAALAAVRAADGLVERRLRSDGVRAPGTVVEVTDRDRGDTYWVDLTYRYVVRGQQRSGHRALGLPSLRRWHSGDRIRIVYDARWPNLSAWLEQRSTRRAGKETPARSTRQTATGAAGRHCIVVLVLMAAAAAAAAAAAPRADAASQVIEVRVSASPDVLDAVGAVAVWRITLRHDSGPVVGDTATIRFVGASVKFSSCSPTCTPGPSGLDASWAVGPLESRITLMVTMRYRGGPGPITGSVSLKDGLCAGGCPVSASVAVADGLASPTPTPTPTPRTTPAPPPTPHPTPRATPEPQPTPRRPQATQPSAGGTRPTAAPSLAVLAATSPQSRPTASVSPSSVPSDPFAFAAIAPSGSPVEGAGLANGGSGPPVGDIPPATILVIIVTAALIPVAGSLYLLSRRP